VFSRVSYGLPASIVLRDREVLATRRWYMAEYGWEEELVGLGSEETVGFTITFPREVRLLLRIEHAGEEDKDASIFVPDNSAEVVVRYLM
jgi:hypothetical protein